MTIDKHDVALDSRMMLDAICQAQSNFILHANPRDAFDELLKILLSITQSEYGFIGEVFYDAAEAPYLTAHAITNIAWDEATRALYDEHVTKGFEFHNLNTLFGAVLTTGVAVIANDPAKDPRSGGLPAGHPAMHSFMGVPVHSHEKLVGMIGVSNRVNGYTQDLIDWMAPVTRTCATLITAYRNNRERMQADSAYQALFENSHDAQMMTSVLSWTITKANAAALAMFGASGLDALCALGPADLSPVRQPDGRVSSELAMEMMETALRCGSHFFEWQHQRLNGQLFCAEVLLTRMVLGDQVFVQASIRDSSARRLHEQTLKITKKVLDTTHDGFWLTDIEGGLLMSNQAYAELSGYTLDELVGMHISQLDAQALSVDEVMKHIEKIISQGSDQFETQHRHRDGHLIDIEVTTNYLPETQQFAVFLRDITERKRLLDELQASKMQYEALAANIPVGVYVFQTQRDGASVFKYVSPRFCELLGVTPDAVYLDSNAYTQHLHAQDRPEFFRLSRAAVENCVTFSWEGRTRIEGVTRWVRIESHPQAPGKEGCRRDGVVLDITERILAKQKLEHSQDLLNEAQRLGNLGSWALDLATGNLYWSDEVFCLFELDKAQFTPSYEAFLKAIHPEDREAVNQAYTRSLETRMPYKIIHRLLMRDGGIKWVEERGTSEFDESGRPLSSRGTVQDISELKNAQIALSALNAELEARVAQRTVLLKAAKEDAELANQAKSTFLSSMSHELRTPLNAILGYAQLFAMHDNLDEDQLENVAEITRAGQFLLALLSDILDLARIESGRMDLEMETVRLSEVLAASCAQNVGMAANFNISIVRDVQCDCCYIAADRIRLLQILNNLISNAIKYNRALGCVTVSCSYPANDRVRICVTDTGSGIPVEKQAQLFQSFNRLGAEMGAIEGTGIGLVITRRLVESMGGRIGVDSKAGQGSTFWVELSGWHGDECCSENHASDKLRVLVAEDFAPNQTVLKLQLESLGCDVAMTCDGAAALAHWRAGTVDFVLTDINMPVMDGLELAAAIRQDERERAAHVLIVAITAAAMPSEVQRCLDAGIDEVLSKPVFLEDLQRIIASLKGVSLPLRVEEGRAADEEAIFDVTHLYRMLGQTNIEHARELVATFIESVTAGLASLSLRAHDWDAIAKELHKHKSAASTVGALRYATHARAMEQQARTGNAVVLDSLHAALNEFKVAAEHLNAIPVEPVTPQVSCELMLVVDDDPVVLRQMATMLSVLGVKEVLTVDNGPDAINLIKARGRAIQALVCDLQMPEMDGVQLIREFKQTEFCGGLILMSGSDEKVLTIVGELARLQGLHVLGQVQKPVNPVQMNALLAKLKEVPDVKHQHHAVTEISVQDIREGIDNDEFIIWYQLKFDTQHLKPVGAEALARWCRADGSFVSPDVFIKMAEQQGLIGELSQRLVEQALSGGAHLHAAGYPLKIAVNLSALWLDDLNLPDFLLATTRAAGLRAVDVMLEVTETGIMNDLTTALDVLSRLRLKGFGLSIDDFGIGYSSFEQLGRIPFTELKLDRSFVIKGNQDVAARAILDSCMNMANKLGLSTVAEGVEIEAELELVRTLGCDAVQGYMFAKPLPLAQLLVLLNSYPVP